MLKKIFQVSFLTSIVILFHCATAMAWTVAPVRFEVNAEKGKEYTLTFSVLNESQLYQKRFEIQTDDWTIDNKNNFLRKAFNKEVNNKYSATSWIKVTPQQFVVPPGGTKNIRFTIRIPNNLEALGEYSTGIFACEKNIEKPPKGEKIIHIKQDTYIGVVVYVRIGEEKPVVVLKDLKVDTKPITKGLNKVIVLPTFESQGNIHSRGQISVKLEPMDQNQAPKEYNAGEIVVLRESEVTFPIEIPEPLPTDSEWKITVSTDLGKKNPILVGTKKYKVPQIEIAETKKIDN